MLKKKHDCIKECNSKKKAEYDRIMAEIAHMDSESDSVQSRNSDLKQRIQYLDN